MILEPEVHLSAKSHAVLVDRKRGTSTEIGHPFSTYHLAVVVWQQVIEHDLASLTNDFQIT
jgi:hypothetical protein